ncbi:septum formation initiator family protein [Porticoccaceae bacterium]|nr:septum formation initiator family protein [Porticoccaceae bacterium]
MFLLLISMLLILQVRLWFGEGSLAQRAALETQIEQQRELNAELAERNQQLARDVQSLKKDLSAIEERARSELGLIKQGEHFFLLVDEEQ